MSSRPLSEWEGYHFRNWEGYHFRTGRGIIFGMGGVSFLEWEGSLFWNGRGLIFGMGEVSFSEWEGYHFRTKNIDRCLASKTTLKQAAFKYTVKLYVLQVTNTELGVLFSRFDTIEEHEGRPHLHCLYCMFSLAK